MVHDRHLAPWLAALWAAGAGLTSTFGQLTEPTPTPGAAFDAAPFGDPIHDAEHHWHGLRWAQPRKIRRVEVEYAAAPRPQNPQAIRLQYWHRSWDGRPDPVLAERGAGSVGWDAMDDWTNGEWKDADATVEATKTGLVFRFNPTGNTEFPDLGHPGVGYRKTLQIRLITDEALARPAAIRAFTDAAYRPLTVRVHWGHPAKSGPPLGPDADHGTIEIFNGVAQSARPADGSPITFAEPTDPPLADTIRQTAAVYPRAWTLPAGQAGSMVVELLMAADPMDPRYDRTIVTLRSAQRPFSFAADEVAQGERILIDDLGALVVRGDDLTTLDNHRAARKEHAGQTVYDRVFHESEQTLERAWNDMPLKRPLYFVHGLPGNRNAMHQAADGTIRMAGKERWFDGFPSPRDAARKHWGPTVYELSFGFPAESLRGGRELRDGYLPLLRTWWQDGPIYYEQCTILDKLDADLGTVHLDDPTVLLMRVRLVNTSAHETGTARLLVKAGGEKPETLYADGDRILADYDGQPRLRLLWTAGQQATLTNEDRGARWTRPLAPGETHELFITAPSVTLDDDAEIDALRGRDFEAASQRICAYWQAITARGARIRTPEPWLNDFYKAHVRHLLVNCYKELDSDRLHAHVGTFWYGVYPNESVMMISDLDRRGYHDEARRNYDAFLHYQGSVKFMGHYASQDGLFYGAGGHETGNYNKSHGYVMWGMADHWWNTRDRAWMDRAAPKLIKACDWITRERQATLHVNDDGTRPIEYGFLPAGSLEDVTDYWYWLATNAASVWGFDALAAALADFGHAEAPRLLREAKAYHDDVMRGFAEASIRTPVVRLRDGNYVPKIPSRLYERGRCHGWLRETLEGAIFLNFYRLIEPASPQAKWILQDYEDNLYISERYGYAIPSFDIFWYSRGGFSMQANLLDGPPPYLYRDEIQHYVRAFFNGFASAFYPDIRMCNEHSLPELGYPAGDHFKSSDEAQVTYWLRLMFVWEDGETLHLGRAIPRYWLAQPQSIGIERAASYFGPLSWTMTADPANDTITARVTPPTRNRPKAIHVRFRHPTRKPIQSVTVNGQPSDRFDVEREWVILPGDATGEQTIVVR
ncbi:MAG: hypothetical protein JXA69_06990, partial [Phycisphaerae bacterium]|nr:hypothetical protein [Phycisphaerae bacterium]